MLLVENYESGQHRDHQNEVNDNADTREDTKQLHARDLCNVVGEEGSRCGERGDEDAAGCVTQRAAHHADHLLVVEDGNAYVARV